MADEPNAPRTISSLRLFPWLRLLTAVRVATDAKKLILAAVGLVLMNAGWRGLDRLFPASAALPGAAGGLFAAESTTGRPAALQTFQGAAWEVSEPVRALVGPFLPVFSVQADGGSFLHAFLAAVWTVGVWGILGGAICRIAVVQVTSGGRLGLGGALRFALRKTVSLVGAPLTPLIGVALCAGCCAGFGLLYRIPGDVGSILGGVFLVLPLLGGLLMALILGGLAVGWPLMHATVAAEREDGFDALSRSYAYVHQRPGPYAGYLGLAWALGSAGVLVVDVFARIVVHLTYWALSLGGPRERITGLLQSPSAETSAGVAHSLWLSAVQLLAHGWVYSYFWTVAAVVYLLLRLDVDGEAFHRLAGSEDANQPGPAPGASRPSAVDPAVQPVDP